MAYTTDLEDRFVRLLLDNTVSKLSGNDPIFQEIEMDTKPHRRIIIGTLAPKNIGEEKKTIVNTTAKSVSFLSEKFEPFNIEAALCVFYKKKELSTEEDETKKISIWRKKYIDIPIFEVKKPNESFDINFTKTLENILNETKITNPKWAAYVTVETEEYDQNNKKYDLITVTILNDTEEDKNYETTLFDVSLKIKLESKIQPFIFNYTYEGYDENYEMDLQTNNCSADYDKETNIISTTHFKIFNQPKILPKDNLETLNNTELTLEFETFSNYPDNLNLLKKLFDELNQYLNFYKGFTEKNPKLKTNEKYVDSVRNFGNELLNSR